MKIATFIALATAISTDLPPLSDWRFPFFPTHDLDLKKYLTNRSPKRLQSLLASMAHVECPNRHHGKNNPKPLLAHPLGLDYLLARVKQLQAFSAAHWTAAEFEEYHKFF